jgi:DNA (cytosine-5)-methyltransferase 1
MFVILTGTDNDNLKIRLLRKKACASIVARVMGKNKKQHITAVDLFCGAGGLSLGLKNSGIAIAAGVDNDPDCQLPFERNIKAKFIQTDIKSLDGHELRDLFGDAEFKLLAACAPCQPFSGYSLGRNRKSKDWGLLLEVHRLVAESEPDFVTVENVPRLVHEDIWDQFVNDLTRRGYNCAFDVLDASSFGVPQTRNRLVLVGSRHGTITLPERTHERPISVYQAIGHLPRIAAGETSKADELHSARTLSPLNIKRIRASKPGSTWRSWPKALRANCHKKESGQTFPSVYGRMTFDEPSPTITTQFFGFGNGRFGHPTQDRAISLREGAILQSFPQDFIFSDSTARRVRQIGKLIGNAVPPLLAENIGRCIVNHAAACAGGGTSR